jgi:hypothetical protein
MAQRLSPFIVELRRFIAELCADLELVIDLSFRSVENGQAENGFKVVDVLGPAGQIRFEHVISHIQMHREPIRNQEPLAHSNI